MIGLAWIAAAFAGDLVDAAPLSGSSFQIEDRAVAFADLGFEPAGVERPAIGPDRVAAGPDSLVAISDPILGRAGRTLGRVATDGTVPRGDGLKVGVRALGAGWVVVPRTLIQAGSRLRIREPLLRAVRLGRPSSACFRTPFLGLGRRTSLATRLRGSRSRTTGAAADSCENRPCACLDQCP